jgi:hypothetical protein
MFLLVLGFVIREAIFLFYCSIYLCLRVRVIKLEQIDRWESHDCKDCLEDKRDFDLLF